MGLRTAGIARLMAVLLLFNFWVGVPYWNEGYATEAAVAVKDWASRTSNSPLSNPGATSTLS